MPRVIYFSLVREKLGVSEEELEFKGSVKELKEILKEKHPQVADILERVKFAVNEEYVPEDFLLSGDERVAVIPPVSGG